MTMLAEVGAYLDTQYASLTLATNLFLGQMPDAPDTCVALAQRPGRPEYTLGAPDGAAHHPVFEAIGLQVQVRAANAATTYTDAETLAWSIYRGLNLTNVTLSTVRYLSIEPTDIPVPMEEDKHGRITFVFNATCLREPKSTTEQ